MQDDDLGAVASRWVTFGLCGCGMLWRVIVEVLVMLNDGCGDIGRGRGDSGGCSGGGGCVGGVGHGGSVYSGVSDIGCCASRSAVHDDGDDKVVAAVAVVAVAPAPAPGSHTLPNSTRKPKG